MKKYTSYILVTLVTIFCTIRTDIIESDSITCILPYLNEPNTLVIFDIDNTITRYDHAFGNDEWFCYLVNQRIADGYDYLSAINAALPIAYYAHFNLSVVPTEPALPELINYLTALNIATMGLTSRSLPLAERTYEQLTNIGIIFDMPYYNKPELVLPMTHPCLYTYNIIFTSNNDKGETLLKFFDAINYYPNRIIFIDDKMYHVQAVEKAAMHLGIEYIGIRYSRCDDYINHFDPVKADIQLQILKQRNRFTAGQ